MAQVSKAKPKSEPMRNLEAFREVRKMAENGLLPDLTLEEINAEIGLAREERKQRFSDKC